MKKNIETTFKLTRKEIDEALYNYFVQKFRTNKIDAIFSEKDIKTEFKGSLDVSLTIYEEKELN